jgi:hypothetical protein
MELGYNKNFEKGANVSFTLTERINSQDLKQITTFYPIYTVSGIDYTNVSVTEEITSARNIILVEYCQVLLLF